MTPAKLLSRALSLLLACATLHPLAHATSLTETGTFSSDSQVQTIDFTVASPASYSIYTTSYAGGANLDGTTSVAGGFVPVLTLFNGAGNFVAVGGGISACGGSAAADPVTSLCNDASIMQTLTAGSYTLALTEFPTFAAGNTLADGFLFLGNTGSFCGGDGTGSFLETDTSPCVQRTANYAVNISSAAPVPEPSTLALVLSGTGFALVLAKRQLA